MLTQIYEVSTSQEANALSQIGVDHVGILVGDGTFPRELAPNAAADVAAAICSPSKAVALFLSADCALIERMADVIKPAIIHLGAASELLLPAHVVQLRRKMPNALFMRSVPVTGPESVSIAMSYDRIVDFLLLDSHRTGDTQIGALGVTHDWTISAEIVERCSTPVVLAGGLGPDNVSNAIRVVRPAGVDSKTKTDRGTTHAKDLTLVAAFNIAAKACRR